MGYYCISNAIIEGYENRIFQVCNRQLCYFFSIQNHGRAYPAPPGALPNMWGKYKRNDRVKPEVARLQTRWRSPCSEGVFRVFVELSLAEIN